ncbi:MAG: rhomboid family intramembrane serine protease [Acidobacteria bacterium]|nr:rhomboid family intramembrane serine protease [Acidobacteriota bacterium]
MESFPSRRVLETLLSRKPREYSLEVGALSFLTILGISLLAWQNGAALLPTLAATSEGALKEHEYWRLMTAVAVHADMAHFFSNAIFLALFPYLLFGYFGFWVFPILGLGLAGLTNYLSLLTYPAEVSLLGASGLVYWMAGFWLSMYLLVDRSLGLGKRVMRAVVIALLVLFPTTLQENVSYRTHAIGFGLGVVSAFVYFRRNRESIRAAEVVEMEEPFDNPEKIPPF